jgi:hypothetical protein
MYGQVLVAAGDIGGVVGGVSPSWGPFGSLGTQAKVVIGVVMAAVIVACFIMAALGAAKQRVGGTGGNSMRSEDGKSLMISGIAGVFLVASLATIFGLVYGMGI